MKSREYELKHLEVTSGYQHTEEMRRHIESVVFEIEKTKAKNKQLETEVNVDKRLARSDAMHNEAYAKQLSAMFEEGNLYTRRIEQSRKKNLQLSLDIAALELQIADLSKATLSKTNIVQTEAVLSARIKKMESELDRKMMQLNERINSNKELRKKLDDFRTERVTMDAVYTSMESETLKLERKIESMNKMIDEAVEEEIQATRQLEQLKLDAQAEEEAFEEKLGGYLKALQDEALEVSTTEKLEELTAGIPKHLASQLLRDHGTKNMEEERALKEKVTRGRWQICQGKVSTDVVVSKYRKHREFLEKMHEVSGATTVNQLVQVFIRQEKEHFAYVQRINQLAKEIEVYRGKCATVRDEIGQLKVKPDTGGAHKGNRAEELKARISATDEYVEKLETHNKDTLEKLRRIGPLVSSFHERIGCKRPPGEENTQFADLRKPLSQIETRIVELLMACHNLDKGSSTDASNIKKLSPGTIADPEPVEPKTEQPYRYNTVKPPTLRKEDLHRSDHTEDEYPLTYDELKTKVWKKEDKHRRQKTNGN